MISIFTTYIYQPFFNILVGIYWILSQITDHPDMGVAVAIFAVIVSLVMLPLSLAGDRTASERKAMIEKLNKLKKEYSNDPIKLKQEERKIFHNNPAAVLSETLVIAIQLIVIIMLYRIFKTGLEGADFHLLYDFMPPVPQPINLVFLDKYDLSRPNFTLNLIQSLAIFVLEGLNMLFSESRTSRKEFLSLAIFMPIVSFVIFALLPAGKKVFIITTLTFSIFLLLIKQLVFWYHTYLTPPSQKEA